MMFIGDSMEKLVNKLIFEHKTIAIMESCTGGGVANAITNIAGASEVLKFSAVTYSNDFKIKMGVSESIINKYSVYSIETAMEMSKKISLFSGSHFGVGVTGKLNRADKNNLVGSDNKVFISIYDASKDTFYNYEWIAVKDERKENKDDIINLIKEKILEIL